MSWKIIIRRLRVDPYTLTALGGQTSPSRSGASPQCSGVLLPCFTEQTQATGLHLYMLETICRLQTATMDSRTMQENFAAFFGFDALEIT